MTKATAPTVALVENPQPGERFTTGTRRKGRTVSKVTDTPRHGETIPRGYSIVPHDVARDPSLSPIARLLYVLIDGHCGAKVTQPLRLSTLARELGASVSTVRRYLKELEQAGLVSTHRTGRALIFRRVNSERKRSTSERSDTSRVNTPKRSKDLELTTTTARPTIKTKHTAQSAPVVAEYLQLIHTATGVRIGQNKTVHGYLTEIAGQGITPEQAGTLTAAYLAAHQKQNIQNPAGFIVQCVLPALAAGETEWDTAETTPVRRHPDECQHGLLKVYGCEKCREINQRKAQECRAAA